MSTNAKPYKDTLNLPVTRFAMKANLTTREPERQERWKEQKLYQKIREARAGTLGASCTTGRRMPMARSTWGTC